MGWCASAQQLLQLHDHRGSLLVNKFVPCWCYCGLLVWAVFGSSLFPNNAKSSLLFSNRQKSCADLEPGPAPAKTHMRMGGYFLFGKFQFCFRFLGEFKVCFRKLDMEADMLDKIIETLDPKAQKHDQSRRQIDITQKMTYNSKAK